MAVDTSPLPGQRGPTDHAMRTKVVDVAHRRFRSGGYHATSVVEIAADLQVAPTYIYKFFRSKNAIGEAVCASILHDIHDAVWQMANSGISPREKLLELFKVTLRESLGMFFSERKLHDLVSRSLEEHWSPIDHYQDQMRSVITHILTEGVSTGSFDAALDLADACEAVVSALRPFAHPTILEQTIEDDLEARAGAVGRFCLRAVEARVTK